MSTDFSSLAGTLPPLDQPNRLFDSQDQGTPGGVNPPPAIQPIQSQAPPGPLGEALRTMTEIGQHTADTQAETGIKGSINLDGTATLTMEHQQLQRVLDDMNQMKQTRAAFAAESQKLASQENYLRNTTGGKIGNVFATIAGNLASQDSRMPGWVQALGKSSLQLNPTADTIAQRRLGLLKEEAGLAGQEGQMASTALYHKQQMDAREETAQTRRDELVVKRDEELRRERNDFLKPLDTKARNPKLPSVPEKEAFIKSALAAKGGKLYPDRESAETAYSLLESTAEMSKTEKAVADEQDAAAKRKEKTFESGLRDEEALHRFSLARTAKREDMAAAHTYRVQETEKKLADAAKAKGDKPTAAELKNAAEVIETKSLITALQKDLDEHPEMYGPWWQGGKGLTTRITAQFDEATSDRVARVDHATPIMVLLLKEGTRGYSKNQREFVEQRVPKLSDTPERAKGKLDFIQSFLAAREKGENEARAYVANAMAGKGNSGAAPSATGAAPSGGKAGTTKNGVKWEVVE